MAQALFIAFITQICITLCGTLGISLWIVDAPDIERHGPEWQKRRRFFLNFGFSMLYLMLFTLALAIILHIKAA